MAKATVQPGGIRLIDPNPSGENVKHEDLMVYVKLKATTKSRSILTSDSEDNVSILEQELTNVPGETNYTYPQGGGELKTNWTGLGGGSLAGGTDLGTFGITSIDIDIKSSFIPQVQINFVDIRGATLFEQGPCSPYASFFHMPYPVFELTIKGFYGKAVTYTLALRKFNTKFNTSTGNFEVKCDFIGYTYAFLADLVMGYALAAPYMPGADGKLISIWNNLTRSVENPLPSTPITLKKMLKDINSLEDVLGQLSNSSEFQEITQLNTLKDKVADLNTTLTEYQDFSSIAPPPSVLLENSEYPQGGMTKLKILKTDDITTTMAAVRERTNAYFGINEKVGIYEAEVNQINLNKVRGNIPAIKPMKDLLSGKQSGFYHSNVKAIGQPPYYYLDIGKAFKEANSIFLKEIDSKLEERQKVVTKLVNDAVEKSLGYVPTIKNIMTIIMVNMELFLQLLLETSIKAEKTHDGVGTAIPNVDGNGQPGNKAKNKIYPWPKYSEEDKKVKTGGVGTLVETFPGENPSLTYWDEVIFVEDFLTAYLELNRELAIISGDVEGERGFDGVIPLNIIESRLWDEVPGKNNPIPNAYYRDEDMPTIYKNVGERAFLAGDFTQMNSLTAWKSRFVLDWKSVGGEGLPVTQLSSYINGGTNQNKAGIGAYNDPLYEIAGLEAEIEVDAAVALLGILQWGNLEQRLKSNGFPILNNPELSKKWGYIDGLDAANTLETAKFVAVVNLEITQNPEQFKQKLKDSIKADLTVYDTIEEWANVTENGLGVPGSTIKTAIKNMVKTDWTEKQQAALDGPIYTYGKDITVGDGDNSYSVKPNPHNNSINTTFTINAGESSSTTKLQKLLETAANNGVDGPFVLDKDKGGLPSNLDKNVGGLGDIYSSLTDDFEASKPNNNVFSLDPKAKVCTVPGDNEKYKWHFIKLQEWDNGDAGTTSIAGITEYDQDGSNSFEPLKFGKVLSPNGNYIDQPGVPDIDVYSCLVQSPLWVKNYLNNQKYVAYDRDTDGVGRKWQTNVTGLHTDEDQSIKALAYLTLITTGNVPRIAYQNKDYNDRDEGYCNWNDCGDMSDSREGYSAANFFKTTSSQVKAPKHFALTTGAVLWRLRESGEFANLDDPYTQTIQSGDANFQSVANDPIHWWTLGSAEQVASGARVGISATMDDLDGWYGSQTQGTGSDGDDEGTYVNGVKTIPTGLIGMNEWQPFQPWHWPHVTDDEEAPTTSHDSVRRWEKWGAGEDGKMTTFSLIRKFKDTTTHVTKKYMDIKSHMKALYLMPKNVKEKFIKHFEDWALIPFKDTYLPKIDPLNFNGGSFDDSYVLETVSYDRMAISHGNTDIQNMFNELYTEYDIMGYSTPKAFYGIAKEDFSNTFSMTELEFDNFVDGWIDGFKAQAKDRTAADSDNKDNDSLGGKNALDDPDIKLSLYKSFKSIFDKWIARSGVDSAGQYKLFYNKVENNTDGTRMLIDHFNFIDRGFNNIGDKAIIDITFLKSLAEDPTASLYQTVSNLLSKNNFDFHPLPSFIQYEDEGDMKELEKMFEPVTNLEGIDSSPAFICMYVGGTSTSLDIGVASTFCGPNNTITYEYENDGFKFVDSEGNPDVDQPSDITSNKVTAFLVEYGIENQSHFKSVSLDQAEFKETQESLMVIDQLAKGGDASNRASKGQNLYNVYQTRSYTCTVEAMGNMQIQPFMYFQLSNVPMFWGAYLITEVKHNIQPHNVTTTFKGTRVPKIVIPLVTDAYSTMTLGETDVTKGGQSGQDIIDNIQSSNGGYDVNQTYGDEITIGEFDDVPFDEDTTGIECPEGTNGEMAEGWTKGVKSRIRLCKGIPGVSGGVSSQIAQNVMDMFAKAKADGIELTASGYRSMAGQIAAGKTNGCPKNWKSSSQCNVATAPPGFSNHQSGNALDIGTKASGGRTICWGLKGQKEGTYSKACLGVPTGGRKERKDEDVAFKWLIANASTYKLINYWKEPWHWSINGG
jgi:hypothetical protein